MQLLPLAARHSGAKDYLRREIKRRAHHPANKVLRSTISSAMAEVEKMIRQGDRLTPVKILIPAEMQREWCCWLARGLSYHYWGITMSSDTHEVTAYLHEGPDADVLVAQYRFQRGFQYVEDEIGGGALEYWAVASPENKAFCIWSFALFGEIPMGGDDINEIKIGRRWVVLAERRGWDSHRLIP